MLKQNHVIYFILIVAAVIALFLYNPWLLYFQNDDLVHIPLSRDGVLLQHNTFRPVCDMSIMLDYELWGKTAWGYHLTNLLLHAVNSIMVFALAKKFFRKYKLAGDINLKAFTVAVLFWIYMNHSEPVFWIIGRSAMLGMVFFLPACSFYFQRKNNFKFVLSVLFSLLAWLSYESSWIIPAIFLLISLSDIQHGFSRWKQERKYMLAIVIAFVIYLAFRIYFTGAFTGLYESGGVVNADVFFLFGNLARLAIRTWLPPSQDQRILIIGFIVVIGLIGFLITRSESRSKRTMIVFLLLWIISLLPYITLGMDTKGVESERFLYMPSLFICVVLVVATFELSSFIKMTLVLVICSTHLWFLTRHAKQYRFAGYVVKSTIDGINSLHNKTNLMAEALPAENFGALIFRDGLREGVDWLKNASTVDSVTILSQSHTDLPLQKQYPFVHSHDLLYIPDTIVRNQFSINDAYFLYTDSLLKIITTR